MLVALHVETEPVLREPGHIKRPPRVGTRHDALLIDSNGRLFKVVVTDLSSGGFRLETEEPLRIGEQINLRVPRYGDFPAQVRWALGNEAGGAFLEPVNLPDE